jgi:membrane-bound lytic murein transglycosylase B
MGLQNGSHSVTIGRYLIWLLMASFAVLGGIFVFSSFVSAGATARPYALQRDVGQGVAESVPAPAQSLTTTSQPTAPISPIIQRGNASLVSPDWALTATTVTGIPQRALAGYAGASIALAAERPGCHLGWSTLAALGWIESGHGTHAGSRIANDGVTSPAILGPALDGTIYAAVTSTSTGSGAGWDRAMGPLQFISSTWASWGADGNGDGIADPQQIDDAALAAGRYLCHYGDLSNPAIWRTAVFAYNHVTSYVDSVAAKANDYNAMTG